MHTAATVEIPRAIEDVFAYVADLRNMEEWVVGVEDVRLVSGEPDTLGARYESAYTYGGKAHEMAYEVTTIDPSHRLAMRADGSFPCEGTLEPGATPQGTHVTDTLDAGADGRFTAVVFALFGPVLRLFMRRRLATELDELRGTIERADGQAPV